MLLRPTYPAFFHTQDDARKLAKRAMSDWCAARSSGADMEALLTPVVEPDFRLWDAFGVLPTVCGVDVCEVAEVWSV